MDDCGNVPLATFLGCVYSHPAVSGVIRFSVIWKPGRIDVRTEFSDGADELSSLPSHFHYAMTTTSCVHQVHSIYDFLPRRSLAPSEAAIVCPMTSRLQGCCKLPSLVSVIDSLPVCVSSRTHNRPTPLLLIRRRILAALLLHWNLQRRIMEVCMPPHMPSSHNIIQCISGCDMRNCSRTQLGLVGCVRAMLKSIIFLAAAGTPRRS